MGGNGTNEPQDKNPSGESPSPQPDKPGKNGSGNKQKPEIPPGQPRAPVSGHSAKNGSSDSTPAIASQHQSTGPSRLERSQKIETNRVQSVTSGQSSPPPVPDSGASPFAQWFANAAQELVDWAKWILWSILALLLAGMIAVRLHQRSRRKEIED
jgi:hypothetical protein